MNYLFKQKLYFSIAKIILLLAYFTPVSSEEFTIIVLPDTQFYSERHPVIFTAQTQWIRDNKDTLDWDNDGTSEPIIYVAHMGDIVDDNLCNPTDDEWENADTSMKILDADPDAVPPIPYIPYGVLPGNHDGDVGSGCGILGPTTTYNSDTNFGPIRYPLFALDKLAAVCDREIYVESAIIDDFSPYRGGLGHGYPGRQMVMEFYPANEYGNNPSNWWAPSLDCLRAMVSAAGFDEVKSWKLAQTAPQHVGECRGFASGFRINA